MTTYRNTSRSAASRTTRPDPARHLAAAAPGPGRDDPLHPGPPERVVRGERRRRPRAGRAGSGRARRRPPAPSTRPAPSWATARARRRRSAPAGRGARPARGGGRRCCRRPARARPPDQLGARPGVVGAAARPATPATASATGRPAPRASIAARGTLTNQTTSPSGVAVGAEERPPPEDHLPRLGRQLLGQRRAPGDRRRSWSARRSAPPGRLGRRAVGSASGRRRPRRAGRRPTGSRRRARRPRPVPPACSCTATTRAPCRTSTPRRAGLLAQQPGQRRPLQGQRRRAVGQGLAQGDRAERADRCRRPGRCAASGSRPHAAGPAAPSSPSAWTPLGASVR